MPAYGLLAAIYQNTISDTSPANCMIAVGEFVLLLEFWNLMEVITDFYYGDDCVQLI